MANDNMKICENILQWLEQRNSLTYDFFPTFHEQCNIPPELLREEKKDTALRRIDFFKGLLSTGTTKRK
jgi:hypothetical protein